MDRFHQLIGDVDPTLPAKDKISLGVSWVASSTGYDGVPLAVSWCRKHSLSPSVFLYGISIIEVPV